MRTSGNGNWKNLTPEHGCSPHPDPGSERRRFPRLAVSSPDLWISTVPEFDVVDMSASGMALLSNHPLRPGETLEVGLGRDARAKAEVLACAMEHPPTEHLDAQFRIRCLFRSENEGMTLLVNAKQQEPTAPLAGPEG